MGLILEYCVPSVRFYMTRESLRRALSHLPLDLTEISKQACLSRYHFLRLFRDTFDTTPHQYLIQRRIERAKELLRVRSLSVTDVCFEVGFQSLGSFSALFRKCVGDAPIKYRRREIESLSKVPGCFIQMFGMASDPSPFPAGEANR